MHELKARVGEWECEAESAASYARHIGCAKRAADGTFPTIKNPSEGDRCVLCGEPVPPKIVELAKHLGFAAYRDQAAF